MHILTVPFMILTYFGIWKPTEWKSRWKSYLYNLLSVVVLVIMYTFVASEFVHVVLFFSKFDEVSDTLFLLLTTGSVCYKAVAFLTRKNNLINLGNMMLKDCCIPKTVDEMTIQRKFDDVNRYMTLFCLVLVYSNVLTMLAIPLLRSPEVRGLPFKTWLPYDLHRHKLNYWLSFVHQGLGLLACSSISLANDNIVTGFMMQACAQFEILAYRLKTLPGIVEAVRSKIPHGKANEYERKMLTQHVRHHIHIFKYMTEVMKTFSSVILVQFCASSTVITVSIYLLSMKNPGNLEFLMVLSYLLSMMTEFFLYCWFGNEVTLKSTEFAIKLYDMEWTLLNTESWKKILFIIHRTAKPIVVTCHDVIVLSLDTYVNILRISYSSFNLLRSTTASADE